jgi:hypothetical protein
MPARVKLKSSAKFIMRQNAKSVYLIGFIFITINTVISYLSELVLGLDRMYAEMNAAISSGYVYTFPIEAYDEFIARLTPFDGALTLALIIISSIIEVGYVVVNIRMTRGQRAEVKTLFDGFAFAIKIICLKAVIAFFTFLWSLLLFVPGVIASLRYSMAIYILADDPAKGVFECIRESKQMMRGRKLDLFLLELSFLGWSFVGGFINILSAFLFRLTLPIFMIWLQPYISLTLANFYNQVSGRAPLLLQPGPDMPEL